MRFVYPLLILAVLILSLSTWFSSIVLADPRQEALSFLADVQSGSLAKSVKHFGGNACRCPAKGGWGSYLIYVSGQEPNLACLTGHKFSIGEAKSTAIANPKTAFIPWEKPEDRIVDVRVTFDPHVYQPLFLPLPMAYGKKMSEKEFDEFLSDPDKDAWKGFTLRLRPGLEAGAIAPPKEELPPQAANQFQALKEADEGGKEKTDLTMDAVRKALGAEATEYLTPRDTGPVITSGGKEIPKEEIAKRLPRFKSAMLRLHVVRRGKLKDWTVFHFGFMYPVMTLANGKDIQLVHDRRPD